MTRIVFSSSKLLGGLSERQRFSCFQDLYTERFTKLEIFKQEEIPFAADCVFTKLQDVTIAHGKGTMRGVSRTAQHIATETGEGAYHLLFNVGSTPWSFAQCGRELVLPEGAPVFTSSTEKIEVRTAGENADIVLRLPRDRLLALIPSPDDYVLRPLDLTSEPMRYLKHYLQFLNGLDGTTGDPAVIAHIRTTLLDLVALILGATRDTADLARTRGLRAARLQEIVAHIKKNFSDQSFSASHIAQSMMVTPHYIRDILHETGLGFAERVTELRLQKARHMLEHQQYDYLKIGEIALSCGFNDVSYFTRLFRRRFGEAPRGFRRLDS